MEAGHRSTFSSIEWLLRADMLYLCKLVTDIRFDLDDYARDDFFQSLYNGLVAVDGNERFFLEAAYYRKIPWQEIPKEEYLNVL